MPEIVPATSEMIQTLNRDLPRTVRAIAAVEDGKVLGVAGFYPQEGHLVMFADIAAEARAQINRHKRTLIRCSWKVMGMAMQRRMPIVASADPEIEGADRLLLHLGFEPHNGSYQWLGQQ